MEIAIAAGVIIAIGVFVVWPIFKKKNPELSGRIEDKLAETRDEIKKRLD